jgi:predicted enzyme related to lactoylglutathione lyase
MTHPFTYVELHTEDPSAVTAFYRQLFDRKLNPIGSAAGSCFEIDAGEGMPGGLRAAAGGPPRWVVYVRVTDVKAATERAVALGARALAIAQEVPGAGWYGLCLDPAGATFGLWQPTTSSGS